MTGARSFLIMLTSIFVNAVILSQDHNWKPINKGIDVGSIEMIIVNPFDNCIYAATGGGILKSADSGRNRKPVNLG
jgi:hypothetical protein